MLGTKMKMKFPIAVIIGKSLEELTEQKLNEADLAKRVSMNFRSWPRDDQISNSIEKLDLIEKLYNEIPSKTIKY